MYSDIQKQVVKFRKRKNKNVFTIDFLYFLCKPAESVISEPNYTV